MLLDTMLVNYNPSHVEAVAVEAVAVVETEFSKQEKNVMLDEDLLGVSIVR